MPNNSTLPATGDVIATEDVGGVKYQQVKLVDPSPGGTVPVGTPANPISSSDASLAQLTDAMLYILAAILEKMPRVTGNDQAAVSIEAGSVGVSSLPTLANVTTVATVSNVTAASGKTLAQLPDAISQLGALHLYQNITVS